MENTVKMRAKIIDGNAQATLLRKSLEDEVKSLKKSHNITPKLAIVLVGDNPASHTYIKIKSKRAKEIGIETQLYSYDSSITTEKLVIILQELNHDPLIHGILVQMPLPKQIDTNKILNTISPRKDVDGFSPASVGGLYTGQKAFVPCTPLGIMHLIKSVQQDLSGMNAVVIGRSNIVGRPTAELLLRSNCTVTILHSHSRNILLSNVLKAIY